MPEGATHKLMEVIQRKRSAEWQKKCFQELDVSKWNEKYDRYVGHYSMYQEKVDKDSIPLSKIFVADSKSRLVHNAIGIFRAEMAVSSKRIPW